MAVCEVLELILHIDTFRNIDIFNQGLYCLRFSIESPEGVAVPAFCESRRSRRQRDSHNISPAVTNDDSQTFDTRVFTIHYKDEEIKLLDLCVFHCHLKPRDLLMVRVQLLHSDVSSGGQFGDAAKEGLKVVAESEFRVSKADEGLASYIPVTFGDMFFSVADVTLHSVVLNYRLILAAPNSKQISIEELWASVLCPDVPPDYRLDLEEAESKRHNFVDRLLEIARSLRAYIIRTKDQLPSSVSFDEALIPPEFELKESLKPEECTPRRVAEHVLRELSEAAAYFCMVNLCMREIVKVGYRTVRSALRRQYFAELKERYEDNISKQVTKVPAYAFSAESCRRTEHLSDSKTIRRSQAYMRYKPMKVEDVRFIPNDELPIVFEELAYTEGIVEEPPAGVHILMLVHGYQGNNFDMGLIKNYLQITYPHTVLLPSMINENTPDASIDLQGERLALELVNAIEETGIESRLTKISFLGHSMGGIVVRAALPHLKKYEALMHCYISLSTPHLGILSKSNKLVGFGLWFLKKWNKSMSLRQLSFSDSTNRSEGYLFQLSNTPGLNWFRYVVLLGSHQDSYAPFESARIEVSSKMAKDATLGGIYLQMAANILMQLKRTQLLRLDVNFNMKKRNIDSMIGRKAHIQFLENEALVRTLVFSYPQFFQ